MLHADDLGILRPCAKGVKESEREEGEREGEREGGGEMLTRGLALSSDFFFDQVDLPPGVGCAS